MRAVALVHVHEHGRQALERAGVRQRAGVDRAAADELVRELERERLGIGVVAADQRVLVGRPSPPRVGRRRANAGPRRPARRAVSATPRRATVASVAGQHAALLEAQLGGDGEHRRAADRVARSRAVSSVAFDFVASTTRSTSRTASLVRRALDAETAGRSRARGPRRASRSRRRRPSAASRSASARPKLPVPPTIATFICARASSAASATRARGVRVGHQRPRDDRPHARVAVVRVGLVDRRARRSGPRSTGDVRRRRAAREPLQHRSAGPFTARPPISGLTATHGTRRASSALADRRDGQDRPDADVRVARRDQDHVGAARAPRARPAPAARRRRHRSGRPSTSSRWPRATNHSWKGNAPAGVVDDRAQPVVGRGEQRGCRARRARASRAVTAESGSPATQGLRAHEVQPEVAVAEPEPVLAAEAATRSRARSTSRRRGPSRAPRRRGRRARRGRCRGRARRGGRAPRGRRRRSRSRSARRLEHGREPAAKRAPPTPPARRATFTAPASAACVCGPARSRGAQSSACRGRRRAAAGRRGDPAARGAEAARAARAVERLEQARRRRARARSSCRRPPRRAPRASASGSRPERAQVVRLDARKVGVDDERGPVRLGERGGDRGALPAAGRPRAHRPARARGPRRRR